MQHRLLRCVCRAVIGFGVAVAHFTLAQPDPIKFGKVELKELEMKAYQPDTSADAVVLCDFGQSYFKYSDNDGFQVYFEHHIRIKILNKAGYEWANASIPLYVMNNSNEEELINLRGYTYNLAGGEISKDKLTKEAVFEEKLTDQWVLQKFTLPNVKEGSVIEYAYTIKSDFAFNFREWEFQRTIPVVWSEYRARIPEYFRYKQMAQGYAPFHVNERSTTSENFTIHHAAQNTPTNGFSGNTGRIPASMENIKANATAYRWVTKDVPAFREEPFMTAASDYVTKIEFELASVKFPGDIEKSVASTWESITKSLLDSENFGGQLNRSGFLKPDAAALTAKHQDPAQRLLAAFHHVRTTMRWNGQKRLYPENTLKKAYESRTGNSADINLLLVALLREAGLPANPVILSTRDHGRIIESYPLITKFNYVIAHVTVDGKQLLLDATDPFTHPAMLPVRCLNGSGRIISKENPGWVSLASSEKIGHVTSGKITLHPDGKLAGSFDISNSGYSSVAVRRALLSDGKEKFLANVRKNYPAWQIAAFEFANADDVTKPVNVHYDLTIDEHAQVAGNLIYLKPMLTEGKNENPFKLENRQFPVDFSALVDEMYTCTFTIPDGFQVDELPKGVQVSLPENAGKFSYLTAVNGNTIQISSRILLKKPVFYAGEYAYLKEFYHQIVTKHAEQIVLKKIGG